MNNGINPLHGALAMPALEHEPGSPVNQAPITPMPPDAPLKLPYHVARQQLRDKIDQRGPRGDIPTTPSATLSHGVTRDGPLMGMPHDVLTNVARHLPGPAAVQKFRQTSKAARLHSHEAIQHIVLEDPADLEAMITRYPSVEKITLVGDVFSSGVLERIKQNLQKIKHIVVEHAAPERNAGLAAVEHLPKRGTLDADVAILAASRPRESLAQRTRTLDDLARLYPEPVGHPNHVRIEVPPAPERPTRRTLDF